jgi:hypothetical protein
VTIPEHGVAPGQSAVGYWFGDVKLWSWLWPDGVVRPDKADVQADGSIAMKWPWSRGVVGQLRITGHRVDGNAPPVTSSVTEGYGDIGFQATTIFFPTVGCWEITGSVGSASLTFTVLVVHPGQ